jgi:glycosyltransferase involved in cell wall biosynthesis
VKVAVTYRVCQHWRAPVFARLSEDPELHVKVFHSSGVPGTKLVNGRTLSGFDHKELFTIRGNFRPSRRMTPVVFCPTIAWELLRHDPDVILAEGGSNVFTNVLVFAYAVLFRKPIVWWTLGELPGRRYSRWGRIYRWIVVAMERRSSALLGYSSVAMDYFQRMDYPRTKCFRAVNCVDTDSIGAVLEDASRGAALLRKRWGLENKDIVLFVGALQRTKDVDRLILAFAKVSGYRPGAHLVIVGDGPDRERLERLAAGVGCVASSTFTGEVVQDIAEYFQLGSVFVLPGLGGLAISEAMAHSLPVICGRGDGCEVDLVDHEESGFRFEPGGEKEVVDQISEYLDRLLSDPVLRMDMSRRARAIIDERYNIQTYLTEIKRSLAFACWGKNHPNEKPVRVAPKS